MTEITAPKSAVTAEQFADEIREQLKYTQGATVEQAKPADVYVAASAAVRRHLMDSWFKTQSDMVNGNTKAVGYLSAEFLMGKQLRNALLNAGLTEQFDAAVKELGFSVQDSATAASAVWPPASSIRSPRWACRHSVMAFSTSTASSSRSSMKTASRSKPRTTG